MLLYIYIYIYIYSGVIKRVNDGGNLPPCFFASDGGNLPPCFFASDGGNIPLVSYIISSGVIITWKGWGQLPPYMQGKAPLDLQCNNRVTKHKELDLADGPVTHMCDRVFSFEAFAGSKLPTHLLQLQPYSPFL